MSRRQFPPGPKSRMFGIPLVNEIKRDMLGFYERMKQEHGDVVYMKLGPYHDYTFFHPDHIHALLSSHAKQFVRMRRVMDVFKQWNGNSVLTTEGKDWIRQRRTLQPAFHVKRFSGYAQEVTAATDEALEDIIRGDASNVAFDQAMTNLTTAIICRTMFGTDLGDALPEVRRAVVYLSEIALAEMMQPFSIPGWVPTAKNRRKSWATATLDRVIRQFISDRRATGKDEGDLLSMLLLARDEAGDGKGLTDEEVRDNCVSIFLAGHDTTAAGLAWVGWVLATSPQIVDRAQEEVASVVGERLPTFADLNQLPFIEMVVKETLRHYPPAIAVFSRQATTEVEIGGYTLPRGAIAHAMIYTVHHDGRWFDEPHRFDPDRFDPERADQIHPHAWMPFGLGPRTCIGNAFATMEMMLVTTILVQRYRLSPAAGQGTPELEPGVSLRPRGGLHLSVSV